VEQNIGTLGVADRAQLLITSAFLWAKRDLPLADAVPAADSGWLVFCSPPYAFYTERQAEMLALIKSVQRYAPGGSILIVEADATFDFALLSGHEAADSEWDIRAYSPAVVGVWRK
jgi:hypothetical protein